MRKTVDLLTLVTKANDYLATSTVSRDMRLGVASLIETALHLADAYSGFGYLTERDVPHGQWPGIMELPDYVARGGNDPQVLARTATRGCDLSDPDRVFPDDSRRVYFTGKLKR
jgi:hypothetical protein